MRFVDDETTGSTLGLSPEVSTRVSCANRRVLRPLSAGTGADDDARAVTLGFAELCVNAAASTWSRDVVGFLDFFLSSSSSSPSSSTTNVSFAGFFVVFFFLFGPQGGDCTIPVVLKRTLQRLHEIPGARIVSRPRLSLEAAVWRSRVRSSCLTGTLSDLSAQRGRGGTRTYAINCPTCFPRFWVLRGLRRGRRCGGGAGELEEEVTDMMSRGSEFQFALPRWGG